MKTAKYAIVAMGLVLLLSSCFMSNPWLAGGEGDSVYLPPDVIKDTARSSSEPFQFETLLPVALKFEIDFYEATSTGVASNIVEVPPEAGKAVVVVTNSKGNVVYEGGVQADGTLDAQLVLPADPEDMTLTVKAQGYQDRSFKISDLVRYSKIDRKMGLMSEGLSAKELGPPESWDRDGDLVPNVYDAFPDDPDYAFILRYPVEDGEFMTVAYEDLYLRAAAGDADYNDFLAKYTITERTKLTKDGKTILTWLEGDITAVDKIAGYNHLFGIAFGYKMDPEEVIGGKLKLLTYYGSDGGVEHLDASTFDLTDLLVPVPEPNDSPFTHKLVIPLFGNTELATQGGNQPTARFEVDFSDNPIEKAKFQLAPYDPFLYVWNTNYDIHLIGEEPFSGIPNLPGINTITQLQSSTTTGLYTFMDGEGFPWALLVPVIWQHPAETQRIEEVYPFFTNWRESKGAGNTDWYLWYLPNMDPNNEPPEVPVLDPESLEFDLTDRTPQEAKIDITLGTDPDSDNPVILDWTDPPTYVMVEENSEGPESHKVIVDFPDEPSFTPPEALNIYFWCQDAEGAPSGFVPLKLSFVEPTKRMRIIIETFPSIEGAAVTDTILTLYDSGGTELDSDDNNPDVPPLHNYSARIDYQNGLDPDDIYYIRVSGIGAPGTGEYVIRALALAIGETIPAYVYPGSASDDSAFEPDDTATGNIPDSPADLGLGNANQRNRYLDSLGGDVDWLQLKLLP